MARRSVSKSKLIRLARPNSGVLCSVAVSVVVVALAQIVGLISLASVRSISITILGIGFIIFVHELGHFLVAKACGVKCEKFYLGFDVNGLKLLSFKWGETEYGIGAIPLGGYVKMLGQDDNVANAEEETERTKVRNADGSVTVDPRSYTAKSIPQRMAIISAGVIMNLIFAVIFATVAFTYGVEYEPCVIGKLSGGGAAWKAGINPGDQILQFGRQGSPSEYLRFQTDLLEKVVLHDVRYDFELFVQRPDGTREWVTTRPEKVFVGKTIIGNDYRPFLGVTPTATLELMAPASPEAISKLPEVMKWQGQVKKGDVVVGVNGSAITTPAELEAAEVEFADQPLELEVARIASEDPEKPLETPQRVTITIPPRKEREYGFTLEYGAITTVLKDSVAEMAGIKVGDKLEKINGEPVEDPVLLPLLFAKLEGKETQLSLQRGKSVVDVTIVPGKTSQVFRAGRGSEIALEGLGVSFPVGNVVSSVSDELNKSKIDLAPGDVIKAVQVEIRDEEGKIDKGGWESILPNQADGAFILADANDINMVYLNFVALNIEIQRGDKTIHTTVPPRESKYYAPTRFIRLKPLTRIRQTSKPLEALKLGARETYESAGKVLFFLKKLATGGISPTKLGGPLSIAYVANREASVGISRFLLFLTLISANLAIVNFLPIPVLDGGHMMFLTAEAIRGKPVDEKWLIRLSVMGLIFVMSLMLFVISLDVLRFSGVNV